jgi:hypothetical protein
MTSVLKTPYDVIDMSIRGTNFVDQWIRNNISDTANGLAEVLSRT